MKVLVACEFSGRVRDAFIKRGHEAISCDLLDTELPGPHYKGDVMDIINEGWDMMIAFPPCTYLTVTGNKWYRPEYKNRFPEREVQRQKAIKFFMALINANIKKIAIENPIGIMSSVYRKPNQIIQPYYFGDPHRKSTCLWLKNLSRLNGNPDVVINSKNHRPKVVAHANGKSDPLWHYETAKLPSEERKKERSITFMGIANAMAEQWG